MRLLRRVGPLAGLLLMVLGFGLSSTAFAQSALNSALGLSLLNSVSPMQQQAVMSRLGGTSGFSGAYLPQSGLMTQSELQQLQQQQAVAAKRRALRVKAVIPELRGGDWVVVQVGVTLPPRTPSSLRSTSTTPSSSTLGLGALPGAPGASVQPPVMPIPDVPLTDDLLSGAQQKLVPPELMRLSVHQRQRIDAMMKEIRDHEPYQLTPGGNLDLPGFAPIPLLGLTAVDATLRLSIIPAFQYLQVRVTLLPLKKSGEAALKPFGYTVFAQQAADFTALNPMLNSSLNPLSNVPVPSNYQVGPGDTLGVQLYGNQNQFYQLTVGRNGQIEFPQLGPISVGGQLFSTVQSEIESRVAHQMIGVHASVTMSEIRSIQVFVMGDAFRPGVYTVSGLATVTSALYAAGGIAKTGSLRNVELIRNGQVVDTLDLYNLLIHGSTANDAKLRQGDVVFVPPVGRTVAIDGEVERPAIYELKNETTPAQVVALAGGLRPNADVAAATITRILPDGKRVVLPLKLGPGGVTEGLRNGDYIHIPHLKPALDEAVMLQGNVYNPGVYPYVPGMRLTDVLRSVFELKPNSDLHYILIRRELPPDRHVEAIAANLTAALAHPNSAANIPLMPRDRITVFNLTASRAQIIQPILHAIRAESTAEQPEQVVTVKGEVNVPGQYPLEPDMRVAALIRAGGGLANGAYTGQAELTQYYVGPRGVRHTEIYPISLAKALAGNPQDNVVLQPYDVLTVAKVSQWGRQPTVTLRGQVRFPGTYTIRPGETLKSVIERAGGLTKWAFPQGAVFTRVELKRHEQHEMNRLAQRMRIELGVLALRASVTATGGAPGAAANTMIVAKSLLSELKSEQAVGRLVINLPRIMRKPADSPYDVVLRNGDELIVPKFEQEVTVIGEVEDPTSHLYQPGLSRSAYIRMSGGFTSQAAPDKVYVVEANGSVVRRTGGSWWFSQSGTSIKPGDTIVVPINAEKMLPLPFWQAVTGILYNVAIAAAAVHAL
jgi:protein involved in polysaccharide export with SLBB domain